MNAMQFADLLAQGSFGGGFGAGMGAGFGAGIGVGIVLFGGGGGAARAKKDVKRRLTAAIETGELSIVDKNGATMTADSVFEVLEKEFK